MALEDRQRLHAEGLTAAEAGNDIVHAVCDDGRPAAPLRGIGGQGSA
jgi:hypothetical protein